MLQTSFGKSIFLTVKKVINILKDFFLILKLELSHSIYRLILYHITLMYETNNSVHSQTSDRQNFQFKDTTKKQ